MKHVLPYGREVHGRKVTVFCILVAVIVSVFDLITGNFIQIPILYVLPTGMAAWLNRMATAYSIAVLLPLARMGFYLLWNAAEPFSMAALNTVIRTIALVLYAYFIGRAAQASGMNNPAASCGVS